MKNDLHFLPSQKKIMWPRYGKILSNICPTFAINFHFSLPHKDLVVMPSLGKLTTQWTASISNQIDPLCSTQIKLPCIKICMTGTMRALHFISSLTSAVSLVKLRLRPHLTNRNLPIPLPAHQMLLPVNAVAEKTGISNQPQGHRLHPARSLLARVAFVAERT